MAEGLIIDMGADKQPFIQPMGANIAIWAEAEGQQAGLVLQPQAAIEAACRLIAVAADVTRDDLPIAPLKSIQCDLGATTAGERFARLTFDLNGAPLAILLDGMQLAQLTAELAAASREIDRHPGL